MKWLTVIHCFCKPGVTSPIPGSQLQLVEPVCNLKACDKRKMAAIIMNVPKFNETLFDFFCWDFEICYSILQREVLPCLFHCHGSMSARRFLMCRYIRENPDMALMMEQMIRQFLGSGVSSSQDEEQVVDLLESHLEEEMVQAEREGEAQRTLAQEQVGTWSILCVCNSVPQMRLSLFSLSLPRCLSILKLSRHTTSNSSSS